MNRREIKEQKMGKGRYTIMGASIPTRRRRTKKDLKLAREMLHDIEYLTWFWHIGVPNNYRELIQKALTEFVAKEK